MGSVQNLKYPKKSHRKKVLLPNHSKELAEFFGIMIGDGGINNLWQANITLNSIRDAQYARYVSALSDKLFDITPTVFKRAERNTLVLSLASTELVDYLVANGLPRGNKLKQGLEIPKWILGKRSYRLACVRGLVDTDGCIYTHRHKINGRLYKNIGFCFTSYSHPLILQVAAIFEEFGIIPHISTRGQNIYLYREESVSRYLLVFGSSNNRILSAYKEWKIGGVA